MSDELYRRYLVEVQRRLAAGSHKQMKDPHERFMAVLAEVKSERMSRRPGRVTSHFHHGEAARAIREIADPSVKGL